MVDLKKPLEGVPGLLLMGALILFGAAVGMGAVILLELVKLSDALWNFLGGVVGAGLGAALAVMGAVYVQRRDKRDRLEGPINLMASKASSLRASMMIVRELYSPLGASHIPHAVRWGALPPFIPEARKALEALPEGHDLSPAIHAQASDVRSLAKLLLDSVAREVTSRPETDDALAEPRMVWAVEEMQKRLDRLVELVSAL